MIDEPHVETDIVDDGVEDQGNAEKETVTENMEETSADASHEGTEQQVGTMFLTKIIACVKNLMATFIHH